MRQFLFVAGILLLFATEILSKYSLMPFTEIQEKDAVAISYFFQHNIFGLRILSLLLIGYPVYYIVRYKKLWQKLLLFPLLASYVAVVYYFVFYMAAIEVYQPMQLKTFAQKNKNSVPIDKMVIGVVINGVAKAYPIQILGYHHQVADVIGGTAVIITYCTLCRSARVYSSLIDGKPAEFGLIGLNKFNSVLEDKATGSWWQQETGVAIQGPMKDQKLNEISSHQLALSSWLKQYPAALIMQPDTNYLAAYGLQTNDKEFLRFKYNQGNATDYKLQSSVIGILVNGNAKAYDWDLLNAGKIITDSFFGVSILLTLEPDNTSFHVWNRTVNGNVLTFEKGINPGEIVDVTTRSVWNKHGACISGTLQGMQLEELQSYLETWKSWNTFHPQTATYNSNSIPGN